MFTLDDPAKIAESFKTSAEAGRRGKGTPFQSAMSMLTFSVTRAGDALATQKRKVLEAAKEELRKAFGKDCPGGLRRASGRRRRIVETCRYYKTCFTEKYDSNTSRDQPWSRCFN